MNNNIYGNYLFHLFTSKTKPIKDLIELLHELVPEANLDCNEDGIRVFKITKDRTKVVHLKLNSGGNDGFEQYYCPKEIRLGVNMEHLFKIIKLIEPEETLRIYVSKDEPDMLSVERYNNKDKITNNKSLMLIDVEYDVVKFPDMEITSMIKFPSTRFQKLCKELKCFTDEITIKSTNDILNISSNDPNNSSPIKQEITIKPTNKKDSVVMSNKDITIYDGTFYLKPILDFSKCSPLSPYINIYLENNKPLTLECDVCSLGTIKLSIAPKE